MTVSSNLAYNNIIDNNSSSSSNKEKRVNVHNENVTFSSVLFFSIRKATFISEGKQPSCIIQRSYLALYTISQQGKATTTLTLEAYVSAKPPRLYIPSNQVIQPSIHPYNHQVNLVIISKSE